MIETLAESLACDGHGFLRGVIPAMLIGDARRETDPIAQAGLRNPLSAVPALARLARSDEIIKIIHELLGEESVLTRAILFDKTPERNWPVPPHRDTTIAVAERIQLEGYGPWSVKDGVVHVRPPDDVLASMWTLRVAIDPAPVTNGPLRVLPGSHLDEDARADWVSLACEPGDVVLMRPLLMHASERVAKPSRRRVLHLEWAAGPLPEPLAWAGV